MLLCADVHATLSNPADRNLSIAWRHSLGGRGTVQVSPSAGGNATHMWRVQQVSRRKPEPLGGAAVLPPSAQ